MAIGKDLATEAAFHEQLKDLVNEARANGISVEGNWPIVNDDGLPDWDLEIVALAKDRR